MKNPILAPDPDWPLIQRILNGDTEAFREIFERHKNRVINLAFGFLKNRESAEDIAHEVFIKIYEKKIKLDPRAKFTTWLYRVTANAALDLLRRQKRPHFSMDAEVPGQAPGSAMKLKDQIEDPAALRSFQNLETKEASLLLRREIDLLSEPLRTVIILFQFEELSYKEIAAILKITEKAVEKRIYHAKIQLRDRLGSSL